MSTVAARPITWRPAAAPGPTAGRLCAWLAWLVLLAVAMEPFAYARLDLRASRTFHWSTRRLTFFAEVLNALGRDNLGRTGGSIRTNGLVSGFTEPLFPRLPSAGLRVEF